MSKNALKIKSNRLIILGVILFLLFTLARVPADWGAWLITRQPGLALSGVSGSLWKGQASLASLTIENQTITLGKLQWDLQFLSLLTLSPCVKVIASGQAQTFNGTVCSARGGVIIKDADASLPVSLVQAKIPVPVRGDLSIHFSELRLRGNILLKLAGNLNWSNAQASNQVQWIPLGSIAAEFTDNGKNGVRAKIFDLESEIDLALNIELRAPSGGSATGQIDVPQPLIDRYKLADVLAFVGPQAGQENGKTRYQIQQEF
jgi:general secretion pathway protein N